MNHLSSSLKPRQQSQPKKTHRLFFFILVGTLAITSVCFAQSEPRVGAIKVEGNKSFSTREVLEWFSLKPRQPYTEERLKKGLEQILWRYREAGFYSCVMDSVSAIYSLDSNEVDLVINVDEGEPTELGSIDFTGNDSIPREEILLLFDSREGQPLSQTRLEKDIQSLLHRYEEIGYPFARVEVASLSTFSYGGQQKLQVGLKIVEGSRTTIEEIKIDGNRHTKDDVILRELRLKPGEVYNGGRVRGLRKKLERLNLFSSVSEPELYIGKKGGGLLIKVQEGNSNSFDGILGYVPRSIGDQSGYFTGFVNISLRNLFGTGRRFAVRWQREDQETQEVEMRYLEPWVLNFPVNVGVGFLQREQDSSYIRRRFDFKGDFLVTDEFSVSLLFGQDRIIPSTVLSAPLVAESRTTTVGGEIKYDSRDDPLSATSGIYYRSDYRVGRKSFSGNRPLVVLGSASVVIKRLGVDLEFYIQPFSRQVLGVGLHGRDHRSDHIEDGDLYRFGGTNTLRGYRENQFLGSSIVWSNLEYRFLMARRSYIYGFVDTGYYFRPAEERRAIPSAEALRVGYGIGLRVDTSLGLLGVSYALGRGDTFSTGKIHFGVVNQF